MAQWTWGSNLSGQLGDGSGISRLSPAQVPDLSSIISVAAGASYCVALKNDGTVWAWGSNSYGCLGDGTTTKRPTPVQSDIDRVVSIAVGRFHTLALKGDGTVLAWGDNGNGQLGTGTTSSSSLPALVVYEDENSHRSYLNKVVAISAGQLHSIALKEDGTVWAWGNNLCGQLGDGTTERRLVAVQVPGLSGIVAIAGGALHTLALKNDGTVWAWGDNSCGELGDGTTTCRLTPVCVFGTSEAVTDPLGSISINGGSKGTNSQAVTLSLSATTDVGKTITNMCFSNDGMTYTDWEAYAVTKSWMLTDGDGIKTVYAKFKDSTGCESVSAAAHIVIDRTPPVITRVRLEPFTLDDTVLVAAGDRLSVDVSAEDDWGIASITADGNLLSELMHGVAFGSTTASALLGVNSVNVVACDIAGNQASDTSATYKTARILGTSCKSINDPIMAEACNNFLFRLFGRISYSDGGYYISDGSGPIVRLSGYSGQLNPDDLVSVRGVLYPDTTSPMLLLNYSLITKYNPDGSEATE